MSNPIAKEIAILNNNAEEVFVIHASFCPHARDNTERLVCIYAENIDRSYSERFSIERYAYKNNIDLLEIESWYDDLEICVLDDFNSFLKAKANCTFIYWSEEGKELLLDVLKNRFEELNKEDTGKVFVRIPTSQRKSIQVLARKMARNSNPPADLKQFIKHHNQDQMINGFLNNGEESNCFDRKQFAQIASSVVAKADFFVSMIGNYSASSASKGDKSDDDLVEIRSLPPGVLFKGMTLGSWIVFIGLLSTAFGIGYGLKVNNVSSENRQAVENIRRDKTADSIAMRNERALLLDSISRIQREIKLLKARSSPSK